MILSVCMATYQGELYVERQLRSILDELGPDDEVIVVDDCSKDRTVEVIESMGDRRIKVIRNPVNHREVFSFGKAIELARGDVIFLADQDDIWLPGRAALMVARLRESGADLISTNFEWMDASEHPLEVAFDGVSSAKSKHHLTNIIDIFVGRTTYFGCAQAFRRELVPLIMPFPAYVESHDHWIPLAANLIGSNLHIDEKTLRKRKHDNNATSTVSSRRLSQKLWSRWILARSLVELSARRRRLAALGRYGTARRVANKL